MRRKVIYGSALVVGCLVLFALFFPLPDGHSPTLKMRVNMEIAQLAYAADAYRTVYGSFPTGTVNQIGAMLSGENPKRIVFVALPSTAGDAKGRFLDPWGTPYSIAFPTESNVTVKSAGKDRLLGTPDDIEVQK